MAKGRALAAAAAGLTVLATVAPAAADTRTGPAADLACSATGVPAPATAVLPPVTAADSKDEVPEDDLVEVALDAGLPDLGPGVTVTGAGMTLPIPVDVANVDLRFEGGTMPARSWDATSGTAVVVTFRSAGPMDLAAVRLPTVIVSYALDQGSAGRVVRWPSFGLVVMSVERDGVPGLVSCRPRATAEPLNSTLITAPLGLVRRGAPSPATPLTPGAPTTTVATGAPAAPPAPVASGAEGVDGGDPLGTAIDRALAAGSPTAAPTADPAPVPAGPAPETVPAAATPGPPAGAPASSPNIALIAIVVVLGAALITVFARRPSS
jgi:hypothetical protein